MLCRFIILKFLGFDANFVNTEILLQSFRKLFSKLVNRWCCYAVFIILKFLSFDVNFVNTETLLQKF